MAQSGKGSVKKGKPSYFMAILGVTIVLIFIGIFGWLVLDVAGYTKKLKEDVRVAVYLNDNAKKPDVDSLKAYLESRSYIKSVVYVDKEMAKKKYIAMTGDDFSKVLQSENPLEASLEFNLHSEFVRKDTLESIRHDMLNRPLVVKSVDYPAMVVDNFGTVLKWILIILIGLAVLFSTLSIILIDNTIRLAMYSNRFLIKTMQMVGATRQFISKPMNIRAIINGAIAAAISIVVLYLIILLVESLLPGLRDLRNTGKLMLLFFFLFVVGIGITLYSTNRSIVKYLKMKLDDLY